MVCSCCGKDIPEESTFCLHCGESPLPKQPRVYSNRTLVVTLALTAAIAMLGIGMAFMSNPRAQGTTTATATPPPSSGIAKPSAVIPPREFTSEELFNLAAPSVVLIEVFDESGQKRGMASGFVVENGAVATNYHVIRGAYNATVHFSDGGTAAVSGVLGYDPDKDVAILRVTDNHATPLTLGDSDRLQVGNRVMAIGSPKGLQNTISDGLVSGIRNGLIQTTAPISYGSSGGPFFNTQGEVVGVAVSGILDAENLNFFVPINWVKRYLQGSSLTTLADLSKENTVVTQLMHSTISVPAKQQVSWPLEIDRNHMGNPELQGTFSSSGGIGGNVRVVVSNQQGGYLYDSGRTNSGNVQLPLVPGRYTVVVDNTGSMLFPRSVTADFRLKYVK